MSMEIVTVRSEGMTLAKLIWQFLRRQPDGYLELVLEANPDLATKGLIIPVGTEVVMPLDAIPSTAQAEQVVRLWD